MKSEFDDLLRQKIEEGDLPFEPLQWQRMSALLDNGAQKKRKVIIIPIAKGLAAGVACLLCLFVANRLFTGRQTALPSTAVPQAKIAAVPNISPAITPNHTGTAQPLQQPIHNPGPPTTIAAKRPVRTVHEKRIHTPHHEMSLGESIAASGKQTKTLLATYAARTMKEPAALPVAEKEKMAMLTKPREKKEKEITPRKAEAELPETMPANRTSLSIAGGLNYGNLNAGYAMGINGKKKLSKKMFLEGDLALVNNRNNYAMTSSQYFGDNLTSNNAHNIVGIGKAEKITITNQYFYVQFTPLLGYAVSQRLNLGLGPDIQQNISGRTNDTKIMASDGQSTLQLPFTDLGIAAKTEYSLTGRIKTGILYREGVNNLLYEKGYLNRRYVQVQLKYQLFSR